MSGVTLILLFFVLIGILQAVLVVYSIFDLGKPERMVRGDNKIAWIIVILFIWGLGPLLYLTVGREQS